MKKLVFIFGLLGLLFFNIHDAHAKTRIVEIRQIGPDGETEAAVCRKELGAPLCYIAIKILGAVVDKIRF